MIQSMTGFATIDMSFDTLRIVIDLKSLNSKGFDVKIHTSKHYASWEHPIVALLKEHFQRGRFEISFSIVEFTSNPGDQQLSIARKYYALLKKFKEEFTLADPISLDHFVHFDELFCEIRSSQDLDAQWSSSKKAFQEAIETVEKERINEGRLLKDELTKRIDNIGRGLQSIIKLVPNVQDNLRNDLRKKLDAMKIDVQPERYEQEVVYYLSRCDITEEIVRAQAHYRSFLEALNNEGEYLGKRLTFITQELLREINTLGSKANSIDISTLVIDSKCELEKIREQLQNIE